MSSMWVLLLLQSVTLSLAGLKCGKVVTFRRFLLVRAQQQVNIKLVIVLILRQKGGAQILCGSFAAQRFDDVECFLHPRSGRVQIAALALDLGEAVKRNRFHALAAHYSMHWQRLIK